MGPFRRVLVCFDGSVCSVAALALASRMGTCFAFEGGEPFEVAVLNATDENKVLEGSRYGKGGFESNRSQLEDKSRSVLRQARDLVRVLDVHMHAEFYARTGDVPRVICDLADELQCDAIVIGTHGRSGVSRVVSGSVCENVMRRAKVPVIAVRNDPEIPIENVLRDAMREHERLLVPLALKGEEAVLFPFLAPTCISFGSNTIVLLHICKQQNEKKAREALEAKAAEVRALLKNASGKWGECGGTVESLNVETQLAISTKDVADVLTEHLEGINAVLFCTHGRKGFSRMLNGSIAESLLRRASHSVPFLSVKRAIAKDKQFAEK